MKVVIDIPQGLKMDFESENWTALTCAEMENALIRSTSLSKGKWISLKCMDEKYAPAFKCSICEYEGFWSNYCPNCGARMEVEDDG